MVEVRIYYEVWVRGRTGGRAERYLTWAGICGGVWRGHRVTELLNQDCPP
jgi:hypothetical protein